MTEHRPHQVLVTGGAGFIGANFIRHILHNDPHVQIVNLDLLTYAGSIRNLEGLPDDGRHVLVRGDIGDMPLVARLFAEHRIDTVVHFAAESHVDRSIAGPRVFIETNVLGTMVLLEVARHEWLEAPPVRSVRFHHVSTDEVFGTLGPKDAPFCEQTPYKPNSPYSASKASSDHLVRAYAHTYGLPVTISNCSNNYGPYQHSEKFVPTVIRSCLEGRGIPIYGDGTNRRDWLFVEDHCSAILGILRRGRPGQCYCLGGGAEHANIDLARRICGILDAERPAHAPHDRLLGFVEDRKGHDWRYAVDASRARVELGWAPTESLDTGLEKTVRWCVEHQAP